MRPTSRRTHVFSRATTTRRMTTPGVVLGLHPETMRSVREDFFLHVPNDSRETIHGRAFPYRAFVPKGRRVVLARSLVGGRSFTFKGARTDTRVRRAVHGAVRSTGIVLPHRDELPARSRPRVQPVRVSSTHSSPERRDDARRRIDQIKSKSSFNRRRAHSSPSVRALARERNDGANERTRDRWDVDVSRLDAMTRRTVRIGSIRFVQKSARRVNERTSGMIVFCRRESRNQKGGTLFILGSRLYTTPRVMNPGYAPVMKRTPPV